MGEASDLARAAIAVASGQVGQMEVSHNGLAPGPSNWSPQIEQYLAAVHVTEPASWCSAFAAWCIQQGAKQLGVTSQMKFSASALHFFDLNPDSQFTTLTAGDLPCVGVFDHGGGLGHIVLAMGLNDDLGKFSVIAGNTNNNGSRQGVGVFVLQDWYDLTDPRLKGFLRIS